MITRTQARKQFKRIWADQCRVHTAMRDSDLAKNYSWENFKKALLRDGKINADQAKEWSMTTPPAAQVLGEYVK